MKRTEICSNCERWSTKEFHEDGKPLRMCRTCFIVEEIDMNDSEIDDSDVDIGAPTNVVHVYAGGVNL